MEGDMLLGVSASGNSQNAIRTLAYGKNIGYKTAGFWGSNGGLMNSCCDINIITPSNITARIQEMHILIGHIFCKAIDEAF